MSSIDSDAQLIQKIANGDHEAGGILYRRFAWPFLGMAKNRLGDMGLAEDAVQETFASVWRSAPTYRPERASGAAWLYAIARNRITDTARRIGKHQAGETPSAHSSGTGSDPSHSNGHGPEEAAEAAWLAATVHDAVAKLPERERAVIELAYWGGLSHSEIADHLDIPLGTVKTRGRSGLIRLGALLEGVL
ncbi:MAG TPA: sigma-70 family RNA polymerase sigma factor [Gaiellaceae bacterium]|nr:sigma-70 family RNA polymerase sigma factor [Gaiellaceae bacterium]